MLQIDCTPVENFWLRHCRQRYQRTVVAREEDEATRCQRDNSTTTVQRTNDILFTAVHCDEEMRVFAAATGTMHSVLHQFIADRG